MDEYRIVSPGNLADTTPSIAPYFGNNPAFKVFTFSGETFKATDYTSLNYDLATMPGTVQQLLHFFDGVSHAGFSERFFVATLSGTRHRKMQNSSFTEGTIFPDIITPFPLAIPLILSPIRPGRFTGAA